LQENIISHQEQIFPGECKCKENAKHERFSKGTQQLSNISYKIGTVQTIITISNFLFFVGQDLIGVSRKQTFGKVKSKCKSGDSSSVASNYSNINGEKISHR